MLADEEFVDLMNQNEESREEETKYEKDNQKDGMS